MTLPIIDWRLKTLIALILAFSFSTAARSQENRYQPDWANIAPKRVIRHANTQGDSLTKAVAALVPGDQLVIAPGTYNIERLWDVNVSGTAEAPIWITADKDAKVIITRPDAKQNVLNIGQSTPVTYLCVRGLEFTGGGHGLRLGRCTHVWIDQCHIHHVGNVCLSANSGDTHHLYLTRNELHHGSGHAEGMYLGSHDGKHTMSESVIALNHVHDCYGDQGDGIEVKQGSWGNLIAENNIHDTNYPCITVYGTAGKSVNIIERNLCRRSADHGLQVQGEAIVRNNVILAAKGSGFASTDHAGKTVNLQVIHNTIVNANHAFSGGSWNGRDGMVLANNVLYSRDQNAIHFPNGGTGVTIIGNVVLGSGAKHGSLPGRGIEDFLQVSWDGKMFDARPVAQAPWDVADKKFFVGTDFQGSPRSKLTSGAWAR